jgi:hypothetical protein
LSPRRTRPPGRLARLGWFIFLYAASAAAFAAVVYGLRSIIPN